MADEISIGFSFRVVQGYFRDTLQKTLTDDFPIQGKGGGIQKVGLTPEVLDFGPDLQYQGWTYMENLDTTNFIDVGPESSPGSGTMTYCIVLEPGMALLLPAKPTVAWYACARGAESRLLIQAYDKATST